MKATTTPPHLEPTEFPNYWADCVNQGRIDELLALYRNEALLIPTFSPDNAKGEVDLRRYFEGLAARKGLQVNVHDDKIDCLPVDQSRYVIGGTYDFIFEVDGALQTFPSRFTFVVDLGQDISILHHHSSRIPGALG